MKRLARALAALAALIPVSLAATPALAQRSIVIDPGHGGMDPGGVGTGLQEKNIVLDTSLRFRDLLNADTADTGGGGSWSAHLTRDTDVFVSLSGRAAYANSLGADRFMSIHSNAFGNAGANGTETFAFAEGGQGAAMRNLVQEEMIAAWGLTNRGNKTANFAVLRETSMPAELHELAFITNAADAAKLANPAERHKAAEAHLRAIQRHFGIAPYIPGAAPDAPATNGGVVGTVVGPDGPIAGVTITLDGDTAATTAEDGSFSIADVPAGEHVIGAAAAGYAAADMNVVVEGGETTLVELALAPEDAPDPGDDPPADDGDGGDGGDGEANGDDGDLHAGCAVGTRGGGLGGWFAGIALALLLVRRRRGAVVERATN